MTATRSPTPFRVACIQLSAGDSLRANVAEAVRQIRSAHADGADFIALPEHAALMAAGHRQARANATREEAHPAVDAFRDAAATTGSWLLAGTVAVEVDDGLLANRSLLIAPDGTVAARYDKIHMFDVDIPGERRYAESEVFRPGEVAVTADLPWIRLGFSVCYDVRFPALYAALARDGAGMLTVPSAFTAVTGRAHWHVLLRARAIETGCYIVAPAQCGTHAGNRRTFGHALVVSPWGVILAEAGDAPARITAEIDPAAVAEARRRIPALANARRFSPRN